ncbi:hypothetical protein GCM10009557_11630 [Virgisporangium ochraceum]|uniref:Uncharacterized protein n=1 Tax=Virgisporangium ochraceum TaxID=65505 RepID=A0A8J3ZTG4_9ACTN|nr:hypothetical protein [Virgisporangium ochraceum]GIJ69887.1 hypothetical protein Voc01_048040 [Virgisporangium ochraceum]
MSQPTEPSAVTIRLIAVEAAGRRLGATPEPKSDHKNARAFAAEDIIATALSLETFIKTGRVEY